VHPAQQQPDRPPFQLDTELDEDNSESGLVAATAAMRVQTTTTKPPFALDTGRSSARVGSAAPVQVHKPLVAPFFTRAEGEDEDTEISWDLGATGKRVKQVSASQRRPAPFYVEPEVSSARARR
jgi:hypothetical protein